MKVIPNFLQDYFWDVDLAQIRPDEHARFIIERVLEYGNKRAVSWMTKNFKTAQIKKVVCGSRNLSKKSANFWQVIFNLKKEKVLCLKKSFQNKRNKIWPY